MELAHRRDVRSPADWYGGHVPASRPPREVVSRETTARSLGAASRVGAQVCRLPLHCKEESRRRLARPGRPVQLGSQDHEDGRRVRL